MNSPTTEHPAGLLDVRLFSMTPAGQCITLIINLLQLAKRQSERIRSAFLSWRDSPPR
jgi:hypothetical protein